MGAASDSHAISDLSNWTMLGTVFSVMLPEVCSGVWPWQRQWHTSRTSCFSMSQQGIDPILRKKIWDRLIELRDAGRTLFVTTQYVGDAANCDKVGVLAEGRLIALDTPEGLRREAYGGELLKVVFTAPLPGAQRDQLAEAAAAISHERLAPGVIRLVVEDAGAAAARVTAWASEAGREIESVEPELPQFDDVFVELVSKRTKNGPKAESDRHRKPKPLVAPARVDR